MLYELEESIPYAIDLFCDTKLYGQALRLQNRSTGAGIPPQRSRQSNETLETQASNPSIRMQHQHIYPQGGQPWQCSPGIGHPLPLANMYMNPPHPLPSISMPNNNRFPSMNGFIPAFLPMPPVMGNMQANPNDYNDREFSNVPFSGNDTNYSDNQRNSNHGTGRRDRSDNHSNYGRRDDRYRNREDRSRSNDRSRSRGEESYDRRRR